MGIYVLKLPDLGEGVVESEVVAWYVAPGERVTEDQHIADVMTDKATVEIGSPVDGVVVALACEAGEVLAVGRELIRFEVDGAGNTVDQPEPVPPAPEPGNGAQTPPLMKQPAPPTTEPGPAGEDEDASQIGAREVDAPIAAVFHQDVFHQDRLDQESASHGTALYPHRTVLASPSIRHRAREAGVDLSRVPGSGRDGRIQRVDLDIFIASGSQQRGTATPAGGDDTSTIRLSGLRRVIARKIAAAKREIPHYTYIEEVDVTELEKLRQHLNGRREPQQPKLTLLPFIVRALVNVLPRFPRCNANFDGDSGQLTQYRAVHAGIATMTDEGLMVPVVRHCEHLDLWQCAAEIARLAAAARDQSIRPEELKHSTITITSLGTLGGLATTPVINAPETAIIGINRMQKRPVVMGDALVVRNMMNISASFDHRIVDGYDGALLVQALKELLEAPATLFL